jgi:hypothetical protein
MKLLIPCIPVSLLLGCARVGEAFTRPHDQVTGIDNLIQTGVIVGVILVFAIGFGAVMKLLK